MRYKLLKDELFTSEKILNEIVRTINLELSRNLNILDIMGGTGLVGLHIKKTLETKNIEVNLTVADIDKNSLEKIKDNSIKKVVTDINNINLKDNSYDYVFIRFGFHEILKENKEKVLKECYRILKPNGRLVIMDLLPTKETQQAVNETDSLKNLLENRPNKSYFLTQEEFVSLLTESKFKNIKLFSKLQQKISTVTWYNTEQINNENLKKLNGELLNLPETTKDFFKIEKEKDYVNMEIPIGIIIGDK